MNNMAETKIIKEASTSKNRLLFYLQNIEYCEEYSVQIKNNKNFANTGITLGLIMHIRKDVLVLFLSASYTKTCMSVKCAAIYGLITETKHSIVV